MGSVIITNSETLAAAIGRRLRELRDEAGATQEDVARAARDVGLDWTRASVASLETGRRAVEAAELLALPHVLEEVVGRTPTLAELVPTDDERFIEIGSSKWSPSLVRAVLAGKRMGVPDRDREEEVDPEALERVEGRAKALYPGWSLLRFHRAVHDVQGLTEQTTARKLGETPETVAVTALALWGRSLTEERDRRVAERHPDVGAGRRLQALRGHATRELLRELAEELERRR